MSKRAARIAIVSVLLELLGCGGTPASGTPASKAPAEPKAPPPAPTARTSVPSPVHLREDVVVTGGVHGNEPSGALVLPELNAAGIVTFGPCNPWGLANDNRRLESGRDLNRSFARDDVPEVAAVKAFLEAHPPALLLDLHEDRQASGAYLIQHGPDDDLGERIVLALEDEIQFEAKPRFNVLVGEHGVLKPSRLLLAGARMSRLYGLAFFAWQTYGSTTFVVEVPHRWPLRQRKHVHRTIVETARRLFSQAHPLPPSAPETNP